ncbi:MAG: nuclear transport factor 2 family protein [Solirubrobacterales bacterium]
MGLGYAHFAVNRDFRDDLFDPDFVWDMSNFRGWPEKRLYRGVEGAREFMRDWLEPWNDWQLEIEELRDAGDKVVAIAHQRGRSKTTGMPVEMSFAQVWTIRDGRQLRMQMYDDVAEAIAAAGLDP